MKRLRRNDYENSGVSWSGLLFSRVLLRGLLQKPRHLAPLGLSPYQEELGW
jgi:hypothetical protein